MRGASTRRTTQGITMSGVAMFKRTLKKESMEITKISDNEIQVSKQIDIPPTITSYKYDFLISQKNRIIEDANNYLIARQKELNEVLTLISGAEALGIKQQEVPVSLK